MILDESTRNKIFLKILGDYNGVSLKNLQQMEQKLENAFLGKLSILLSNFRNFKKINNGIWILQ